MKWFPTPKIDLLLATVILTEVILAYVVGYNLYFHYNSRWGTDWPDNVAEIYENIFRAGAGWIPLVLSLTDMVACVLLLIAGGHEGDEWAALTLSMVLLFFSTLFSFAAAVQMTA